MKKAVKKQELRESTLHIVNIVTPRLAAGMNDFRMRLAAANAGYPVLTDWHPVIPDGWGKFPSLPFQRGCVYRGDARTWAYSHHQSITKFGDKYVASWSNGFLHEDYIGQEVHFAWSIDGARWSEPQVVVHTTPESKLVRSNAGLYASKDALYCYVCVAKDYGRDVSLPGMSVLKEQHIRLDVFETRDLIHWKRHERICDNIALYEEPRPTLGGKLLCCGFDLSDHHGMVLIWDDPSNPAARPRVVDIPMSPEGVLPEEGTWYQTDDGRIWMYQRDSAMTGHLAITFSDDEGETWSPLVRTDFPNSFSLVFAGRLHDGRFYLVGNNYDFLLDRRTLLLALSDDGRMFDRQYTLLEGDTTRRVNGRHKEDGYHYPNCHVDGDKLFVIYSVNKEDIEVGIVDTRKVD
jgi:hypothetical protein